MSDKALFNSSMIDEYFFETAATIIRVRVQ